MKAFGKQLFSDIHIHIDPIQRDLLLIFAAGFLLAVALVGVASFIFH